VGIAIAKAHSDTLKHPPLPFLLPEKGLAIVGKLYATAVCCCANADIEERKLLKK